MKILGITGSLRQQSHNKALLARLAQLAPAGVRFTILDGLAAIPPFSEDLESMPPQSVVGLWRAVRETEGLIFATPEYNQSIPGTLKNIIDWITRDPAGSPLIGKSCAVLGATTGQWGTRIAQQQLKAVLHTCGAMVLPSPQVYVRTAGQMSYDEDILRRFIEAAVIFIQTQSNAHTSLG